MAESLHIVCPHCETTNRIPPARLEEGARCGQCHEALFDGQAIELNADNFHKYVSRNDIPVLVDFWAPWCGPCQMMAPQYTQAAQSLEPHVRLAKVNTEAQPSLANQFGIRSIPTLALFKGGREVARQAGAMRGPDIIRWVQSVR
jgi:thioredoxin 2